MSNLEKKAENFLNEFEEYMVAENRMAITPQDVRIAWAQGYQAALDDITKRNMCNMRQVYGFIHEMTDDKPNEIEPLDSSDL